MERAWEKVSRMRKEPLMPWISVSYKWKVMQTKKDIYRMMKMYSKYINCDLITLIII